MDYEELKKSLGPNPWRISLVQCWNMGTYFTTYYISWPSFNTQNKGSQTTKTSTLETLWMYKVEQYCLHTCIYILSIYAHYSTCTYKHISHIHIHILKFHRNIGLLDLCKVTLLVHGDGHPVTKYNRPAKTAHQNLGTVDDKPTIDGIWNAKVANDPIETEIYCWWFFEIR